MATRKKQPDWVKRLRGLVKASFGQGWIVREHRGGRTQISRTIPGTDGQRESVTVKEFPWAASSAGGLIAYIERLDAHIKNGCSIQRAAELIHVEDHGPTAASIRENKVDWPTVVERFRKHKVTTTGEIQALTWNRRYRLHMNEFLQMMSEKGSPKNANEALTTLIDRFAADFDPGSEGRKRRFSQVQALLLFACSAKGGGAPEQWNPTIREKDVVGRKPKGSNKTATALKDVDALRVYEDFQKPEWKLAFGLMVCFGLRPCEVLHCRPEGGRLIVEGVKRNQKGEWGDREITGLDPVGAPGMSRNLLAQLEERGADALPPPRAGFFATRIRVELIKLATWQSLVEETLAQGKKGLVPYGARHGFAIRGSLTYRLPLRVTADLMGHTLTVHMNNYGKDIGAERASDEVAAAYERVHGMPMPGVTAGG